MEDGDVYLSSGDDERQNAAEAAAKFRKRAGIPELDLDALPSTIANKMMTPDPIIEGAQHTYVFNMSSLFA